MQSSLCSLACKEIFADVPYGQYKVIVLARQNGTNLMWAETVEINGPIPQFIEVENRIQ
jgi:hypothetical protein